MDNILFSLNDFEIEEGRARSLYGLFFYLKERETVTLLGDRDSGSNTFFDFLCGDTAAKSGCAKTIDNTPIEDYLKKNLVSIAEEMQQSDKDLYDISIQDFLFLMTKYGCEKVLLQKNRIWAASQSVLVDMDIKRAPDTKIGMLSKPELLKLFIGKALLKQPKIIAIDSDLEGFQPEDIFDLELIINKLKKELKVSFIWSTNGLDGVNELSDRYCVFKNGTIIAMKAAFEDTSAGDFKTMITDLQSISPEESMPGKHTFKPVIKAHLKSDFDLEMTAGEIISIVEYNVLEKEKLYRQLIGIEDGIDIFVRDEKVLSRKKYHGKKYPIVGIERIGRKGMFENLSVEENIILPSLKKICKPNIFIPHHLFEATFKEWKDTHPSCSHDIETMSIYERLSAQLESWLIYRPELIVLYEPFLHLDQQGRGIFAQYFSKYKKIGISIIVLTSSETNYLGEDTFDLKQEVFDRVIIRR